MSKEPNYKEAYFLLMEYFDSFDKEQKEEIDRELKKLNL